MTPTEEVALVHKAQQGDREALGELYDHFTPRLFGYLVKTLRNKPLAEDILQTTWIKAIGALPRFQSRASIGAWLFAIARNECNSYWRTSKREVAFDPLEHDQVSSESNNLDDVLVIEKVMAQLSESDQEILKLRYIADLSPEDIAKTLNINFVTARVRIHRALTRAKQLLDTSEILSHDTL